MLLQTNSYVVGKDKRTEHARLLNRFRQTLARLGCESFEVYEQTGANWSSAETSGRFVQIMRFRDRKQQLAVQAAERVDPQAQALIKEFCELINFPYQQQQGLFAVGYYNSVLPVSASRTPDAPAPIESVPPEQSPGEPAPAQPELIQPDPIEAAPMAPAHDEQTAAEPEGKLANSDSIGDESGLEVEPLAGQETSIDGGEESRLRGELADEVVDKHDDNGQPLPHEQQQPHSL